MTETLWGDISSIRKRLDEIEQRLDVLAKTKPDDLIKRIEGLSCALAVAERRIQALEVPLVSESSADNEGWKAVAHDLRNLMDLERSDHA
jgi:hypothetical protein